MTMPILRGSAGSGRLRDASRRPSACSRFFSWSSASCLAPRPLGSMSRADDLVLALRLVDAEPAAREDVLPVLELELERPGRRFEHHGPQLRARVLQREVDVAGRPQPAVGDLALDPHIRPRRLEQQPDLRRQFRRRCRRAAPAATRPRRPRAPSSSSNGRSKRLGIVSCAPRARRAPAGTSPGVRSRAPGRCCSSASMTTACRRGLPAAGSMRAGRPVTNRSSTPARSMPMIESCGPVMPASVM
ncbi:MAG: hypothetical protein MZV64_28330 [Ignavibacteriales bacterium]|nr:hypothetical protein [Ignavibacteriales bacterium]